MKNPFKVGDKVFTKARGAEVEGVVTKLWQNEVQVRIPESELLWRTMYTVWRAGEAPLARGQKAPKSNAKNPSTNTAPPAKVPTPGQRAKTKKSSAKPSNKRR